ncbi:MULTISPECIES: hypothetical protein [unclassified Mesorhizobium]|uniref:hypothetical protein n=1 Tax=unclassified Mesorhizobium TaxID=325217 RepID=UPI001FF0177D|nr:MULTISPECIES: hypothetical protein [unclassified Mesorhizobium]
MPVGSVKSLAIVILLARPVDNVSQVEEKAGVHGSRPCLVVGRHILGDPFRLLCVVYTAVAQRMEPYFTELLNFGNAVRSNDIDQIDDTGAFDLGHGTQLLFAPLRHPRETTARRPTGGRIGRKVERVRVSLARV